MPEEVFEDHLNDTLYAGCVRADLEEEVLDS